MRPLKKPMLKFLSVRMNPTDFKAFSRKAVDYQLAPSTLVRELVNAFVEDRMTITPPSNRKDIYVK